MFDAQRSSETGDGNSDVYVWALNHVERGRAKYKELFNAHYVKRGHGKPTLQRPGATSTRCDRVVQRILWKNFFELTRQRSLRFFEHHL